MKPATRRVGWGWWLGLCCSLASVGCTLWSPRGEDTELDAPMLAEPVKDDRPRLVGDYASPWGKHYLSVEGVALVTGLGGTGSDPPPTSQRRVLIAEMMRLDIRRPEELLADPRTSLVLVRAFLPPGARKGDRIDVEVRTPSRSETTSLKGGWLMETRLQELAVMQGQIHSGKLNAIAQGNVLVNAVTEGSSDPTTLVRGRVLGGGVVTRDRSLGLVLKESARSVPVSRAIGAAINERFHVFEEGSKRGVATPKNDEYVQIVMSPIYCDNVSRYLRVVREIPLRQDSDERQAWIKRLEGELLDPQTSTLAALRLEAIGRDAIPALRKGLQSTDPEVRLYSAEALAYLQQAEAASELASAARSESAFRWHALTALSALDDLDARDALCELLRVPSAETRYGAFRALRSMNPLDPMVQGQQLGQQCYWHHVASTGDPQLHISTLKRPEIVAFGTPQRLDTGFVSLNAGPRIMVQPAGDDKLRVTLYQLDGDRQVREIPNELGELARTVIDLNARYDELIELLVEANKRRVLSSRLVFNALPKPGRSYTRGDVDDSLPEPDTSGDGGEAEDLGDLPAGIDAEDPSASDSGSGSSDEDESIESLGDPLETLPEVEPTGERSGANASRGGSVGSWWRSLAGGRRARDTEAEDDAAGEVAAPGQIDKTNDILAEPVGNRPRGAIPELFSEPSPRERQAADAASAWAD